MSDVVSGATAPAAVLPGAQAQAAPTIDAATAAAAQATAVSVATTSATNAATAAATAKSDAVLAKIKAVLLAMGHDVDVVFDDIVALAKKSV